MEAREKKEALRLAIVEGPPELDLHYALARRITVPFTFVGVEDGGKREVSVYVDGLKAPSGKDEGDWTLWGHFNADGKGSWVPHPNQGIEIYLWGDFLGEYDKRTRLGRINTINYLSAEELAQQILQEQASEKKEGLAVWKIAKEAVQRQIDGIGLMAGFVYTERGLVDIDKEAYLDFAANVESVGLQLYPVESEEASRLRQYMRFLLRGGLEKLCRKYPEKFVKQG